MTLVGKFIRTFFFNLPSKSTWQKAHKQGSLVSVESCGKMRFPPPVTTHPSRSSQVQLLDFRQGPEDLINMPVYFPDLIDAHVFYPVYTCCCSSSSRCGIFRLCLSNVDSDSLQSPEKQLIGLYCTQKQNKTICPWQASWICPSCAHYGLLASSHLFSCKKSKACSGYESEGMVFKLLLRNEAQKWALGAKHPLIVSAAFDTI